MYFKPAYAAAFLAHRDASHANLARRAVVCFVEEGSKEVGSRNARCPSIPVWSPSDLRRSRQIPPPIGCCPEMGRGIAALRQRFAGCEYAASSAYDGQPSST